MFPTRFVLYFPLLCDTSSTAAAAVARHVFIELLVSTLSDHIATAATKAEDRKEQSLKFTQQLIAVFHRWLPGWFGSSSVESVRQRSRRRIVDAAG